MAQDSSGNGLQQATAAMPPAMAEIKSQSVDEVLKEMNRMPLFMTTLDETDGEGGENTELEALKALAYEGTKAEIAENFRQQGNECARAKQWTDAKEFYDKAIAALKASKQEPDPEDGRQVIEIEIDEEEEAKKEKIIEEACYTNRALCNLEKSKFQRSTPKPSVRLLLSCSSLVLLRQTPVLLSSTANITQKTTAPVSMTARQLYD